MKNFLFKVLVSILQKFVKKNRVDFHQLRILILSTTGLGDSLWATPAFQHIKQTYPNSCITILTTKLGRQVFLNNPYIHQVFLLEKLFSLKCLKLWKALKKSRFQVVLHFHSSQRYVLPLCATIGAENIIGTTGLCKGLDFLLTHCFAKKKEHEIERRLNLLTPLNIKATRASPQYFLTKEDKSWAALHYRKSTVCIGMHPKAKDGYKCWPISHFIELGKLLESYLDCKIYITGMSHEKEDIQCIKDRLKNGLTITDLPLRSFASLLSQMDLFISNDTGPMHLSCALNIPTIGIFSSTDPTLCGPTSKEADLIYKSKTCNPCLQRKCAQPFCFYQISPSMVFHRAKKILAKI